MIEPLRSGDELVAEMVEADAGLSLWWLGQSGFLLTYAGRYLLFDPYLSDSLSKKYRGTDRPHVRMTAIPVAPARLDFVDVVTSSHSHTDHLDAETLGPLLAANSRMQLVLPEATREMATERLGAEWSKRMLGIDDGRTQAVAGFRITGFPAAHETVDRDEAGRIQCLGYIVEAGRWKIYHSGDTVRFDGMAARLKGFGIDIAILPINGRRPERRVAGNLTGEEAAQLAHDIGARIVVPCHFEMFTFNTESPDAFVAECDKLEQRYRVLRCGERLTGSEIGVRM